MACAVLHSVDPKKNDSNTAAHIWFKRGDNMPNKNNTAAELFDISLPKGLQMQPEKAREVNTIYSFKISGEGGGEWTCDLTSNPPHCYRGLTRNADCAIGLAHDHFLAMMHDPSTSMQLYFGGQMRVSGDPRLTMNLPQLFALAPKKIPS